MPINNIILILLLLCASITGYAQPDTSTLATTPVSRYRISLLTCGPGPEVWETFGHACIRVIDSSRNDGERDKIYNYGFFEVSEGNSIWKQAFSGRVRDLLDTITYEELMYEYRIKQRSLIEQEFLLTTAQKDSVVAFLKNNLKQQFRYYEFDTFYDNCSTRIRDLFETLFGNRFIAGKALPPNTKITFRDVTVTPLCPAQNKYWFGLGVNLLYASRTDRVMSERDALFSPVFLSRSFTLGTLDGKKIIGDPIEIQKDNVMWTNDINMPMYISFALAILTITSLVYNKNKLYINAMTTIVMVLTGLIGCLAIYAWTMDGEPAWKENYNILWAMPLNLLFPVMGIKTKTKYSFVCLILIVIAIVFNVLRIQVLPLTEVGALILALIWIHSVNLKKSIGSFPLSIYP